jgi:hypothetical protein
LVAVFTDFVAHQRAGCGTANGPYRAAEDGIACDAAYDGTDAGTHLGIGGVGGTTTQGKGRGAGGRKEDVTDFHGKSPLWCGFRPCSCSAGAAQLDL